MIRSSAALTADDVSIRCRVRHSPYAVNHRFGEAQEYTCTMRNWESRHHRHLPGIIRPSTGQRSNSASSQPDHNTIHAVERDSRNFGPELLLTPTRTVITNRDESPVRRSLLKRKVSPLHCRRDAPSPPPPVQPVEQPAHSIPISDIMVVETFNVRKVSPNQINITTLSMGFFEFDCISQNGHDILLAFLQASLPAERVLDGSHHDETPGLKSTSSTTSCFDLDVDALTAQHMQGRADRETWPEKFSRRMGKVVSSLSEISSSLCDISCGRNHVPNKEDDEAVDELRDMPPVKTFRYSDLEMDENDSQMPTPDRHGSNVKDSSSVTSRNSHTLQSRYRKEKMLSRLAHSKMSSASHEAEMEAR